MDPAMSHKIRVGVLRLVDSAPIMVAQAHGLWFLNQMRRWGWLSPAEDVLALSAQVYRPDLLTAAVAAERLYPVTDLPDLESTAVLPHWP